MAGTAEFLGGSLITLGLLTPLAAVALISVMTAAVLTVHLRNGFCNTSNGYEYNLVLAAAAFVLAGVGAGNWSLDSALGLDIAGTAWAPRRARRGCARRPRRRVQWARRGRLGRQPRPAARRLIQRHTRVTDRSFLLQRAQLLWTSIGRLVGNAPASEYAATAPRTRRALIYTRHMRGNPRLRPLSLSMRASVSSALG